MRKFAGIVESTTAPPTNCLWLLDGDAKYFSNGKWRSLLKDNIELGDKVDALDKEMGTVNSSIRDIESELDKLFDVAAISKVNTTSTLEEVATAVMEIRDILSIAGIATN